MEKRPSRAPYIISMTIIGIALVFLILVGMLAFIPVNVIQANVQPYKVATSNVKAGDEMVYIADICKYKEIVGTTTRTFVDEAGVQHPVAALISNIGSGCRQNFVVVPTLPSFRSGKWYLDLDVEYQVNAFRTQTYHFRTDVFTISNAYPQQ